MFLSITPIWILSTAVTCLLTPLYGLITSSAMNFVLITITLWLVWNGIKLIRDKENKFAYHFAFNKMNTYILSVMLLLSIDRIIFQ